MNIAYQTQMHKQNRNIRLLLAYFTILNSYQPLNTKFLTDFQQITEERNDVDPANRNIRKIPLSLFLTFKYEPNVSANSIIKLVLFY